MSAYQGTGTGRWGRYAFLALLSARAGQLAVAFAVSVLVVWRYGLPAAGTLALAALPGALCSLATAFGLANALPRIDATQGERATAGLVITVAMTVPCAILVAAYAALLGHDRAESVAILGLALSGGAAGAVNVQQILYILQGRSAFAPLTPALHLAGTGVAALMPDLEGFALVLLATRVVGCAVGFLPLSYARLRPDVLRASGLAAARFAPLDIASLLADQLPILILSALLSRADLGLLGLLRQFVTVADTPGWSYVASNYPRLVDDLRGAAPAVARRNERVAWMAAGAVLAVASGMAFFVYRAPGLVPLLPVVLAAMPARYLSHFCDQSLRASGHVGDCLRLSAVRGALALSLTAALTFAFGLWGAVTAMALLSLASGLLYRGRLLARHPGILGSARPWRLAGA